MKRLAASLALFLALILGGWAVKGMITLWPTRGDWLGGDVENFHMYCFIGVGGAVALSASLVLFSESGGRNTGLTRRGLFDNKKFFQIGFMVLALSGLLVTAEDLIYFGLNSTKFHWSSSDLLMVGLSNLANVVFAILFLRYLSKKYNAALALTTLTLTVVGWIATWRPFLLMSCTMFLR